MPKQWISLKLSGQTEIEKKFTYRQSTGFIPSRRAKGSCGLDARAAEEADRWFSVLLGMAAPDECCCAGAAKFVLGGLAPPTQVECDWRLRCVQYNHHHRSVWILKRNIFKSSLPEGVRRDASCVAANTPQSVRRAVIFTSGEKRVHFELGKTSVIQTIEIRWPSGIAQTLKDVAADKTVQIDEPATAGTPASSDARPRPRRLFRRGAVPHKRRRSAASQPILSKLPVPADVELRGSFAGIQNQQHDGTVGILECHIF